jgi:hypothetical protein
MPVAILGAGAPARQQEGQAAILVMPHHACKVVSVGDWV